MRRALYLFMLLAGLFTVDPSLNYSRQGEIYTRTVEAIDTAPPSIQVIHYLKKYTDSLGAPYQQIRRSLEKETSFRGLLDFSYNPYQVSSANALGPLQVMKSTGKFILPGENVTEERLLNSIKLNLKAGTTYAKYLLDRNPAAVAWRKYNGADSVNKYARYVAFGN